MKKLIDLLIERYTYERLVKKVSKLEFKLGINKINVNEPLADDAAEALGKQKGESLGRFINGPLNKAGKATVGTFALAQVLDTGSYAADKLGESGTDELEAKATKKRQQQRLEDEQVYEEEMEEAYKKGLFLDYTADAIKNKYKAGYQPGLPGDPNLSIVQNLYDKRNNHTRM